MEKSSILYLDDTDDKSDSRLEKHSIVKTIESFDVRHITRENVDVMVSAIQDYFREHFPVKPELVNQIPDHLSVLSAEDYQRAYSEFSESHHINFDDNAGYYDLEKRKIIMNASAHRSAGTLFTDIFHESLHIVSILAGAGFSGKFAYPPELENDQEVIANIDVGMNTLIEGTTQLITLSHVIGNLGFDENEGMLDYEPECRVMHEVWFPFPKDDRLYAYFQTPLDEMRIDVEKLFEPEENRDKITSDYSTGVFADCIANLGISTEDMKAAIAKVDDSKNTEATLNDVHHSIEHFVARLGEKEKNV